MEKEKEITKKHRTYFSIFLGVSIFFIVAIVLLFRTGLSFDKKLSLVFVVLVVFLIILLYIKPYLSYYSQLKKLILILNAPGAPLKLNFEFKEDKFMNYLTTQAFLLFGNKKDPILYYRYTKDKSQIALRNSMLEIITLDKLEEGYNNAKIQEKINQLEDHLAKTKVKFRNYSIIKIKIGNNFDKYSKEIENVVFERQFARQITVINVYLNVETGLVHFLYNESYTPSVYYDYVVKLIKSLFRRQ